MTTFNEQMKQMLKMMEEHSKNAEIEEQKEDYIQDSKTERRKVLYQKNKEYILAQKKLRYEANKNTSEYKERAANCNKKHYEKNKDKYLKEGKEKYQNKKENLIYNNNKPKDYSWFKTN